MLIRVPYVTAVITKLFVTSIEDLKFINKEINEENKKDHNRFFKFCIVKI